MFTDAESKYVKAHITINRNMRLNIFHIKLRSFNPTDTHSHH